MDLVSFHSDLAVRSTTPPGYLFLTRPLGCLLRTRPLGYLFAGKISADNGGAVLFNLLDSTFGDDRASLRPCFRAHLDEPVRLFQNLGVVIHQKNGVPVSHKVVHNPAQADNVSRVQADRGLVENVQYPCCSIADRAGQLHSLPFAGRQCRRCSVERKITEAKVHQSRRDFKIRLADIAGHRTHLLRQRIRNSLHPLDGILQGHLAGLIKGDPHQFWRSSLLGQSRAAALRTDVFLEELLHPLHPLFILHLVQRIEYSRRRTVISKIHLARSRCVRFFGPVKNMLFDHRAVVDDLFLLVRQVAERNISSHAHSPADIGHQGPHEGIPGSNRSVVDCEALVRYQRVPVYCPYRAGSPAALAGALGIKRQLLRARSVKRLTAFRAYDLLHKRHLKSRFHIVPVRTAVGRKAREHQAQAVEKLCSRAKSRADARNTRPLPQRKRRRDV